MTRLASELPGLLGYLRHHLGISRRTFERWCARGDVPGAYRTRGGHWRVRKPSWATVKTWMMDQLRTKAQTRRDRVKRAIVSYPLPRATRESPPEQQLAARKLQLAAYEITEEDVRDLNLKERDPEKHHILWEKSPPPPIPPWAWKAATDPRHASAIAAFMMRLNGSKVTGATLARALGMSVATLYRRYGKEKISETCSADTELAPKHSVFF